MRPPDFRAEHSLLWDAWVLEHGVPELPRTPVALDECIPVACWAGPRTAAVLHVYRSQDGADPEPHTGTDLRLLDRVGDGWEYRGGSGDRYADEFTEPRLPAREVRVDGNVCTWWSSDDDGRRAIHGEVGADAAVVEVEQLGDVTRRAVEAPTGRFVVCVVAEAPCRVRFFDRDGELLTEIEEPAGVEDVPRRA